MMEKPYNREEAQIKKLKEKFVYFDKNKRPKLRVYRSSKDFGDSMMHAGLSRDYSLSKSIDHEEGISIINRLAKQGSASVAENDYKNIDNGNKAQSHQNSRKHL